MICHFCSRFVSANDLHNHHPLPKSQGGTVTLPTHKSCHLTYHKSNGHFRDWGRVGGKLTALTRRWAFNLKNVRDHPLYEIERQYYRLYYAKA